jgi:antitoxin component YwqK of YwqJK toxin-antitoxin module
VTYPDGKTEYLWVWGEKKISYPDGQFELVAADSPFRPVRKLVRQLAQGDTRIFYPDGHQEYRWQNGSRQVIVPDRGLVEFYPNGKLKRKVLNSGKEVHYWYFTNVEIERLRAQNQIPAFKRIIYPDGRVQYEYVPL